MPLLDHFHPPISKRVPWRSALSGWTFTLTTELNLSILSQKHLALPSNHFQTDHLARVLEFESEHQQFTSPPTRILKSDLGDLDTLQVRIRDQGPRDLIAAIELVSPNNKDSSGHRRAFAARIAGYLQEKIGVVVIDVVSEHPSNMHAELMRLLGAEEASLAESSDLIAAAYRATGKGNRSRVEMWLSPLTLNQPLPTMPLWLGPEQAVPLDLEATYAAMCSGLRLP